MGMATVYEAISSFLDPTTSGITYLGEIYSALPKVANENDLFNFVPPGTGVGAIIYTFISNRSETRIALGGAHDGRKWVQYGLTLLCVMKSDLQTAAEGQATFNTFLDSLIDYIRSNRNAGDPSVVFQWGEGGQRGGPDIDIQLPVPKTADGGVTVFQAVCKVAVIEIDNT